MTPPTDLLVGNLLDLGQQLIEPGLDLGELLLLLDHVVVVRGLADQHIEVDPLPKPQKTGEGSVDKVEKHAGKSTGTDSVRPPGRASLLRD